eukprot:TRINITY_DN175_c0_g2_i1.p2 TRINITY_DN175_c0_g2~~TRINITY_DN175_c0_g2_i1.p2  ORF type:complete len:151 (-),score=50.49 TRINITY_DN175_c0_g2_i1:117-569(-)
MPIGGAAESIPAFVAFGAALAGAAFLNGITFKLPFWGQDGEAMQRTKLLSQEGKHKDPFDYKMLARDRWIQLERSGGERKKRADLARASLVKQLDHVRSTFTFNDNTKEALSKYSSISDQMKLLNLPSHLQDVLLYTPSSSSSSSTTTDE